MATKTVTDIFGDSRSWTALTIPFVQPTECVLMRDLAINTHGQIDPINLTTLDSYPPLVLSHYDYDDPRFASCLPPGWAKRMMVSLVADQGLIFSPAVCPKDYETFDIQVIATKAGPGGFYTQAECCQRGYTSRGGYYIRNMFNHCISSFGPDESIIATVTEGPYKDVTTTITSGLFIAPIWQIRWEESDLPSLSPQSTQFSRWIYTDTKIAVRRTSSTSRTLAKTRVQWGPASLTSGLIYTSSSTSTSSPSSTVLPTFSAGNFYAFVTIGLPVVFSTILISCIACWLYLKRKQRKVAVILETERLRMDLVEASEVQAVPGVQGGSDGLPVYTAHDPPAYTET